MYVAICVTIHCYVSHLMLLPFTILLCDCVLCVSECVCVCVCVCVCACACACACVCVCVCVCNGVFSLF